MKSKSDDVYEDFYKDKNLFDFRNYLHDSKFFDPDNEKLVGKMKNESKGKIIYDFIRLKSKMYSIKDVDGKNNKRGREINQNVVKT